MKLTEKKREDDKKAKSSEQTKEFIAEAGMELTDEEMDQAAGGDGIYVPVEEMDSFF